MPSSGLFFNFLTFWIKNTVEYGHFIFLKQLDVQFLAAQLEEWRKWGWPIVKMVNFSVRLPRGPPEEGPWNEVLILNRTTREEIRRAQNYGI